MFKAIILLTRHAQTSREAFADWWLNEHAPLARQLPGLRKLTFNLVSSPADIDGVSELWFDSATAFEAAYASAIGQQVAADSMAHVARRERLLVTEHPQVDGTTEVGEP